MARLSRADLESILAFAGDADAAARETERAGTWLVARMASLVNADHADYANVGAQPGLLSGVEYPDDNWTPTERQWVLWWTDNPFAQHAGGAGGQYFSARRLS